MDTSSAHSHSRPIISRKDAIKLGLKKYFDGQPCERGHIAQKYVLGYGCSVCRSDRVRNYAHKQRETEVQELPRLTRAQRGNRRSNYSNLRNPDDWYAQVNAIRNGKRFVFGSTVEHCRRKPLAEGGVIFAPKIVEDK